MFHRQRKTFLSSQAKSLKDLTGFVSATQVLAEEKRKVLLHKMKELIGLDSSRYDSLCVVLIENLVNYCQYLPETSHSYYSQPGGLIDHALNRTEAALSLFKEFVLLGELNALTEEQKLWQYALYSAAILQGIGKLFVDYRVHLYDVNGQPLKQWNPLLESLVNTGNYYDYDFLKEPEVEFRRRLNLLLARTLMPVSGFSWLAEHPQVLAVWLALLNEDSRSAGTLGAILSRADAIAIQRYFSEFLIRTASARSGRFGRAGTFSGGVPAALSEKEQIVGIEFLQWLQKGLDEGRIMVNKAPLLMVPGGLLMSQEMFQWFVRENSEYKNWQAIQKGFLSLGLHGCGADGGLISRFEQAQTNEMHSGVVFSNFGVALPGTVKAYHLSTGKTETLSATDLIHRSQYTSQFNSRHQTMSVASLEKLSASGQWLVVEGGPLMQQPGVKRSG